jgi:hypothetical protein
MDKRYTQAVRMNKLHEALIAAGITPTLVEGDATSTSPGTFVHIVAPQTTAAVDAVVAAHDATIPGAAEQQAAQDASDLAAFPTRAQVASALTQLNTDLTTLSGSPTNAQLIAVLNRTVTNQRAIIRALSALVHRG